jgi:hypothetical protein
MSPLSHFEVLRWSVEPVVRRLEETVGSRFKGQVRVPEAQGKQERGMEKAKKNRTPCPYVYDNKLLNKKRTQANPDFGGMLAYCFRTGWDARGDPSRCPPQDVESVREGQGWGSRRARLRQALGAPRNGGHRSRCSAPVARQAELLAGKLRG